MKRPVNWKDLPHQSVVGGVSLVIAVILTADSFHSLRSLLADSALSLLDIAETDLLHGHPILTIGSLALLLIVAAPLRSRGIWVKTLHTLAFGLGLCLLSHFLFRSDLAARNDLAAGVLICLGLTVTFASTGGLSSIIGAIFRLWLRKERHGAGALQALELILFGAISSSHGPPLPSWLVKSLVLYHNGRKKIGRKVARSHSIETAFERSLDAVTMRLRQLLDSRLHTKILPCCSDVASAATAELDLLAILRRFDSEVQSGPFWPSRLVKAWDLIRWADWIGPHPSNTASNRFLEKLETSPVATPWLRVCAREMRNRKVTQQSMRQLERHLRAEATGEEIFGSLLLLEALNEGQLSTWTLDFLGRQNTLNRPFWVRTALARVRLQAEARVLRLEEALGPGETAVRRSHYSALVLQADPPGFGTELKATLVRPLQTVAVAESHRSTGQLPPLPRVGLDLGTGLSAVTLLVTVCVSASAALWLYQRPFGPPLKPLTKLSGPVTPAACMIAAADATPEGANLLMATRGDGLHRLNSTTFRLRSQRPDNGGPTSPWLSDVAVSKTGQIGVVTYLPADQGQSVTSTGADIETAAGWLPVIRPTSLRAPDADKITHFLRVGANKLLHEDSRWLIYRNETRELGEITFEGLPDLEIVAADGQSEANAHAFVVVRTKPNATQSTRDRIFELDPGLTEKGSATEITGTFPASERVSQILASGNRLWIRTQSQRLYEREGSSWRLRLDGNTDLAMERISHFALNVDTMPTLWLVEAAENGRPTRVRARVLSQTDFLPKSAWRIYNLNTSEKLTAEQPTADTVKLNANEPTPIAMFDPVRKQPVLLVAGRSGGLGRFFCNPEAPTSPDTATLDADIIKTPGEKLLSLDVGAGGIVAVLESEDGTARRVTVNLNRGQPELGLGASQTVMESILPNPESLAGAKILLAVNATNKRDLFLLLDTGRILTWDRNKRGFTNRAGMQAKDENGENLGALLNADLQGGKILVNDSRGRVLELAENELLGSQPRFRVVHQALEVEPPANLAPLHVATTGNGVDVFFGNPTSAVGEPWHLGPVQKQSKARGALALISWIKPSLSELLNVETLTRIQTHGRFENLIALGESGKLFWRDDDQWMPWPDDERPFNTLINAKGATFAVGAQTIRQVEVQGGRPTLYPPVWESASLQLRSPITALAGLESERPSLLVGHARGLAVYSPKTRRWEAIPEVTPVSEPAAWTFLSNENASGISRAVWAIEKTTSGEVKRAHKVYKGSATTIEAPIASSVALAGDRLAIWDRSNGLRTHGVTGTVNLLISPNDPDVGDTLLRRISGTKVLYALDKMGRLLTANPEVLSWKAAGGSASAQKYRDIETDTENHLLLINANRVVLRGDMGLQRPLVDLQITAEGLQQTGEWVAAFDPSHGSLSLIDTAGMPMQVAGGKNSEAIVGASIRASLTHGDTVFFAGPVGAVFRDPKAAQTKAIPESAGITRFAHVGNELFAYRGNEIYRLFQKSNGGEYRLERLPAATKSVIAGPDGKLWVVGGVDGLNELVPYSSDSMNASERLFRREGKWPSRLNQAVPWKRDSAIIVGSNGELLHYQPAQRALSLVRGSEALSKNRKLLKSGNLAVVKSSDGSGATSLHLIDDAESPKLVPLESDALDVVPFGGELAWIRKTDSAVQTLDGGSVHTVVSFPIKKPSRERSDSVSQILLTPDDTFWGLAGSTAFEYSFATQTINRTVDSVTSLAKERGQNVAITRGPAGAAVLKLDGLSSANVSPLTGTGIGDSMLLTWQDVHGAREINLGTSRQSQTPGIPEALRKSAGTCMSIPNTSMLAWLSSRGEIFTYDTAYARWKLASNGSDEWTDFGMAGNTLIACQNSTTAQIGLYSAEGKIVIRDHIQGQAWFTREGWIQFADPNIETRNVVLKIPGGSDQALHGFTRATPPFNGQQSGVFDSSESGAALLFLSHRDQGISEVRVARDAGRMLPVTGLPEKMNPEGLKVFTDSTGFIVKAERRFFHVSASNGSVEKLAASTTEVGFVDKELYYLERGSESMAAGFRLRRWADKRVAMDLGRLSFEEKDYLVKDITFVKHQGHFVVELTVSPDVEGPEIGPIQERPLILMQQRDNWVVAAKTAASQKQDQSPLRFQRGSQRGLTVLGMNLAEDGWFDSMYPVAFEPGADETNQLPLRMRDSSVRKIDLPKPAAPRPYREIGQVTLVGNTLQNKVTGAVFGVIAADQSVLVCDAWREARPISAESFLALDGLGQVWHWKRAELGFKRELLRLPAGELVAALGLPLKEDGSILLVDAQNRSVAKFIDGKITLSQGEVAVRSPAERPGEFKTLKWSKSGATNHFRMTLAVKTSDAREEVEVDFSSNGLSIDRPVGLAVLPNDSNLWLRLATRPDGRWLICPADREGVKRIGECRIVDAPAPPPLRGFSTGALQWSPRATEWDISLAGTKVEVSAAGSLAIDEIRRAATLGTGEETTLFLETSQPGVLVAQRWISKSQISPHTFISIPQTVENLRTRNGELLIQTQGERWKALRDNKWVDVTPDWSTSTAAPSLWNYERKNGKLSWDGADVPMITVGGALSLEADILSAATEQDGTPFVSPGKSKEVVYQSVSGNWYTWKPGLVVSKPTLAPGDRSQSTVDLGVLSFPRRSPEFGTYRIRSSDGQSAKLPLSLHEGRLPHQDVERIDSWGAAGFVAKLRADFGSLIFDQDACIGKRPPDFKIEPGPIPATPSYDRHSFMQLTSEVSLHWKKVNGAFALHLQTKGNPIESPIGALTIAGVEIDHPSNIRPVSLADNQLEFTFKGALWIRKTSGSLSDFRVVPERIVANLYGPLFDADTEQVTLGVVEPEPSRLSKPWSGRFSRDGRRAKDESFEASMSGANEGAALVLSRIKPQPCELRVNRGKSGWEMPFSKPCAAFISKDGLALLSNEGDAIGYFTAEGRLQRTDRTEASVRKLWRRNDVIQVKRVSGGFAEWTWNAAGVFNERVAPEAESAVDVQEDTFSLMRAPQTGDLSPFWKAAEEQVWREARNWQTDGLPGGWPHSAVSVSADTLLLADSEGIRRFNLSGRVMPPIPIPAKVQHNATLCRRFGDIEWNLKGLHRQTATLTESTSGILLKTLDSARQARIGQWLINQTSETGIVSFYLTSGPERFPISCNKGGFDFDHVSGLFSLSSTPWVTSAAGLGALEKEVYYKAPDPTVGSILGHQDLALTQTSEGPAIFSRANATQSVGLVPELPLRISPKAWDEYIWIAPESEWSVLRSPQGLWKIARRVETDKGNETDLVVGSEIFSGNQLAFDHVCSIQRDPRNELSLLMLTDRAIERLPTQGKEKSQVIGLGNQMHRMPSWHEVSQSRTEGVEFWIKNQKIIIPRSDFGAKVEIFDLGRRIWIIDENSVRWMEGGERWRAKRER